VPANEDSNPNRDPELLAAVIEHQPLGVAVISLPNLAYEYVNPAFQAFAPGKQMVGKRNDQVSRCSSLRRSSARFDTRARGAQKRTESNTRTPDGPLRRCSAP
jgi:hypothetical protein